MKFNHSSHIHYLQSNAASVDSATLDDFRFSQLEADQNVQYGYNRHWNHKQQERRDHKEMIIVLLRYTYRICFVEMEGEEGLLWGEEGQRIIYVNLSSWKAVYLWHSQANWNHPNYLERIGKSFILIAFEIRDWRVGYIGFFKVNKMISIQLN